MQISQYLDEDYFRMQEYVSRLVDGLPTIGRDTAYDKDLLIRSLLHQNKAYGNQIIYLCKTLDSVNTTEHSRRLGDSFQSSVNNEFVMKLKDKIREYEHALDKLSAENNQLYFQVKELTAQKEEWLYQQRQEREYFPTGLIQKVNSPLRRVSIREGPNQVTSDIENLLREGDIEKASEILAQIDYKRPYDVLPDHFNNWLVVANKMKDGKLNDVLGKVRNIADMIEAEATQKRGEIDILSFLSVDKLLVFIEERLTEMFSNRNLLKLEPLEKEPELENDQLQTKVKILKNNLSSMELELQEKHTEVTNLKERLIKVKNHHSRQNSLAGGKENLLKDISITKDFENIEKSKVHLEIELKEATKEKNDAKDAAEMYKREIKELTQKVEELNKQIYEKDQLISRLVLEGKNLGGEQEMVQKLKEELAYKETEISSLLRQIVNLQDKKSVGTESKTSAVKFALPVSPAASVGEDVMNKSFKENLTLESALHVQGTLLFNLDKVLKDLKNNLKEVLAKSNVSLPQEVEHVYGPNDGLNNARADAQKLLKENNNTIQSLLKEAYFVKSASQEISIMLSEGNVVNSQDTKSLTSKVRREEERLAEKLSKCIKALSQVRAAVCDAFTSPQITQFSSNKTLTLLQNLYINVSQLIGSFPEISNEVVFFERNTYNSQSSQLEESCAKKLQRLFKEQLTKEQKDISTAMRTSLQNVSTEDSTSNGIMAPRPSNAFEENQRFSRLFQENCARMSRIISIFNKGLGKASESISQLAKLADSEDAFVLVGDALNEVDALRAHIQELGLINQMEASRSMKIEQEVNLTQYEAGNTTSRSHTRHEGNRTKERSFKQRGGVRHVLSYEESSEIEEMNESLIKKVEALEKKNQELNSSYNTAVKKGKEEVSVWTTEKHKMSMEIERKDQELGKMNQLLDSLQNLSNKQLEVVKDKEEKLSSIMSQKKNNEQLVKDLEKKVEDLIKEKSETIAKKTEELEDIIKKYNKLKEEHKVLEAKHVEAADLNKILKRDHDGVESLRHEMNDKVRKLNELLQVTRNELRNCRQIIQEKNSEIMLKEEEIQSLRDGLKRERNLNKESEFVAHLKQEIQVQSAELNTLRKKNAELLKANEQFRVEIQLLSNRKQPRVRDMNSEIKGDLSEDYEAFQKSLRRRDAQYNIERNQHQSELRSGRGNTFLGSTRDTERQDKEGKNLSTYAEPRHLKGNKTLTSPRDIGILSGRDQSLTSTMRDLTKNLGIPVTQDSQYKRYHSMKYLSPE